MLCVSIGKAARVYWCLSITKTVTARLPSDSICPPFATIEHQLTITEHYDAYLAALNEAGQPFVEALCNGIARSIRARQNTAGMITPAPPTPIPAIPRINLGNIGRRVAAMNARLREPMEVPSSLVSESRIDECGLTPMPPSTGYSPSPSSALLGHSPSPSSATAGDARAPTSTLGQSALAQALRDD